MNTNWMRWAQAGLVAVGVSLGGQAIGEAAGTISERIAATRTASAKKDDAARDAAIPDSRNSRKLLGRKRHESTQPVVAPDVSEINIPGVEEFADGPPATAARGSRLRAAR